MNTKNIPETQEIPRTNIRKATLDDASAIAKINYDGWTKNFRGIIDDIHLDTRDLVRREMKMRERLDNEDASSIILVYEKEWKVLWFVHGGVSRDEYIPYEAEIYAIYIAQEVQWQGIGKILMNVMMETDMFKNKKSFFLRTLRDQKATRWFYEKFWGKLFLEEEKEIGDKKYPMVCYYRQK